MAGAICSICYEDLKPIVEDLQAISICGHVFHELCLQQWFEYSVTAKKCTCPVCKQSCSSSSVARLYFQSVGDQNEVLASQKTIIREDEPELLRGEVRKLEAKLSSFSSILERQGNDIKHLNEELFQCKDKLRKEVALRNDAVEQKVSIQRLLRSKSEELDALKLDNLKLQDRNMALAKELAALKLVSDLNLDEEEILKLASFGNEANNRDTIDVLRKSLVTRNKSYKDLMAKCNELGRGEARSSKKLEKAKQKIDKLKTRVKDLEMAVEVKDNEGLRALKASKEDRTEVSLNVINESSDAVNNIKYLSEDCRGMGFVAWKHSSQRGGTISDQEKSNIVSDMSAQSTKGATNNVVPSKVKSPYIDVDECDLDLPTDVLEVLDPDLKHPSSENLKPALNMPQVLCDFERISEIYQLNNPGRPDDISTRINKDNTLAATDDEEVTLLCDNIRKDQALFTIKKESPFPVILSKPGDKCFSSGLLGPDGTNRYLGKWCKRRNCKESVTTQGTNTNSGNLITVGPDGKGGRVKVLRSWNESSLVGESISSTNLLQLAC
ncbi:hypothetical protein K2173_025234 [Erythroxylum novogranatense]|uniref:RING-type domain-containing protein n=1 Tax=Erythroxylum novogranatense TaxID=1862640 RepID=A0AAV8UGW5_9ROSI|nr:hypothetical protein K2173_025234 [Erythroxylum novogranatense]